MSFELKFTYPLNAILCIKIEFNLILNTDHCKFLFHWVLFHYSQWKSIQESQTGILYSRSLSSCSSCFKIVAIRFAGRVFQNRPKIALMSLGNLKDHLVNTVFNNCISVEQKSLINLTYPRNSNFFCSVKWTKLMLLIVIVNEIFTYSFQTFC